MIRALLSGTYRAGTYHYCKLSRSRVLFSLVALLSLATGGYLPVRADNLAKDMYYQQLNEPTRATNKGFRYWIELQRQGQTSRVNNRFRFRTGDRIKFHVSPNIDCYAHIVLVGGTTGNKAVLFPIAGKDPTNYVRRGTETTIPSTSFLQFDNNPGCEHLQVVLALRKLSQAELLKTSVPQVSISPSGGTTSATTAMKVSFDDPKPVSQGRNSDDAYIANAIPDEDTSKDLFRSSEPANRPRRRPVHIYTPYTTVVNTDPTKDLYADISLAHD